MLASGRPLGIRGWSRGALECVSNMVSGRKVKRKCEPTAENKNRVNKPRKFGVEQVNAQSFLSTNNKKNLYNHVSVRKKILKIQSQEVDNVVIMVVDTFWSTEIIFWRITTNEGLIPVSDTVLAHLQGSQVASGVKKPV